MDPGWPQLLKLLHHRCTRVAFPLFSMLYAGEQATWNLVTNSAHAFWKIVCR